MGYNYMKRGAFTAEVKELPELGPYVFLERGGVQIRFSVMELDNLVDLIYDIEAVYNPSTGE